MIPDGTPESTPVASRRAKSRSFCRTARSRKSSCDQSNDGQEARHCRPVVALPLPLREARLPDAGAAVGRARTGSQYQICGYDVRPAIEADIAACNLLCRRVHGFEHSVPPCGVVVSAHVSLRILKPAPCLAMAARTLSRSRVIWPDGRGGWPPTGWERRPGLLLLYALKPRNYIALRRRSLCPR